MLNCSEPRILRARPPHVLRGSLAVSRNKFFFTPFHVWKYAFKFEEEGKG